MDDTQHHEREGRCLGQPLEEPRLLTCRYGASCSSTCASVNGSSATSSSCRDLAFRPRPRRFAAFGCCVAWTVLPDLTGRPLCRFGSPGASDDATEPPPPPTLSSLLSRFLPRREARRPPSASPLAAPSPGPSPSSLSVAAPASTLGGEAPKRWGTRRCRRPLRTGRGCSPSCPALAGAVGGAAPALSPPLPRDDGRGRFLTGSEAGSGGDRGDGGGDTAGAGAGAAARRRGLERRRDDLRVASCGDAGGGTASCGCFTGRRWRGGAGAFASGSAATPPSAPALSSSSPTPSPSPWRAGGRRFVRVLRARPRVCCGPAGSGSDAGCGSGGDTAPDGSCPPAAGAGAGRTVAADGGDGAGDGVCARAARRALWRRVEERAGRGTPTPRAATAVPAPSIGESPRAVAVGVEAPARHCISGDGDGDGDGDGVGRLPAAASPSAAASGAVVAAVPTGPVRRTATATATDAAAAPFAHGCTAVRGAPDAAATTAASGDTPPPLVTAACAVVTRATAAAGDGSTGGGADTAAGVEGPASGASSEPLPATAVRGELRRRRLVRLPRRPSFARPLGKGGGRAFAVGVWLFDAEGNGVEAEAAALL